MTDRYDRNATALATLRIPVGVLFLLFGAYPYPWMNAVLKSIVLPHARLCAFLTAYGKRMIGVELVSGVLTRTASGFGIMLMALLLASSRLRWAARCPMTLFWRLAPVIRFYRMYRCIHHRRTRSAVSLMPRRRG